MLLLVFFSLLTNDPILGALPDWLLHNYISFLVGIIVDLKKKGGGGIENIRKTGKNKAEEIHYLLHSVVYAPLNSQRDPV